MFWNLVILIFIWTNLVITLTSRALSEELYFKTENEWVQERLRQCGLLQSDS